VENLLKTLESYIFPKHCLNCGRNEGYICDFCEKEIKYISAYSCIICNRPSLNGFIHRNCVDSFSPDRFLAAFEYDGVVKKALINAKYKNKVFDIYTLLVSLACSYFDEIGLEVGEQAFVVPVPTHYQKYKKRTFDHTLVIAELFAKRWGLKVISALDKVKSTPSQSLLGKKQRKKNVEGVFKVDPKFVDQVRGKDIVVIDDIVTTGSTMLAACKELRKLGKDGPRYIYCVSLAYDSLRS